LSARQLLQQAMKRLSLDMKKILFYASVRDRNLFQTMGFYATDIKILEDCGYDVTPTNRISDFLKYGSYDIVLIYFWTKGLLPAIVAKSLGKKVLFTGGIDALDRGFNRRALDYTVKKWLFRACAAFSDANIIVSRSDLANVRQAGVDVSSVQLVPHVIDVDRYAHDGRQKKDLITTVAWMGTKENVQRKGLDRLLRVFGEFVKKDNRYTLMLIGPGGEGSDYLARVASELDIASRVVFTGEVTEEDKIRMLQDSKYYFQLSAYEGFGISAIEALAAGNLVFHSARGGLSDSMPPEGIEVTDIDNFPKIAETLAKVNQNYGDYQDRISSGVRRMREQYAYCVRKERIEAILYSLVS